MSNPEHPPVAAETGNPARQNLGVKLKAAREAQGLSTKDVAQRLRLDTHVVEALEADDPERLPARTFVRGYLRNYARLVGLDENLVTEALPEADATPAAALKRRHGYRGATVGPALGRWLGYLFLLVLLAGLVLFAYPAVKRVWDGWQEPVSATGEGQDLRLPTPGAVPSPPEGGLQDLEPIWPLPDTREQTAAEEVTEQAAEGVAAEVPEAVSEPEPAPVPEVVVPGVQLVLSFRAESWVEVRDRDGRVLYGLMTPGRREVLSGTPPFRLLLGNAAGVDVEYDGRRVDTAPHTQGAVARFSLE
jgi:cytoskeleton protein RodZ